SPSTTAQYYNAVRIAAAADGAAGHNAPIPVWFTGFVGGAQTLNLNARAVAVGGGPCSNNGCTLPMVVPSCSLLDGSGNLACGTLVTLHFNYGYGKQVALADVVQPSRSVSNSEERQQMADGAACRNPVVEVGDVVALGNGNDFNSQVEANMYWPTNIVCR